MGFPRTEGAVQNWRDCLGAAIRPAPRVAYRNRCRRLQPPVPRQTFCPPPQKKPGLARKYGRGEKSATRIRHAGKYRVSFGGPRWRRPRIQQYKNDSLQRLFPPPKDPHLDSRYLGPWCPQPRALFFFTENGRPGHVTAPLGEQAVGSPHWSPGRQKSRRVDFSHRRRAVGLTSTQRKFQMLLELLPIPAPQHRERIKGSHRNKKLIKTPLAGYLFTHMLGAARGGPL